VKFRALKFTAREDHRKISATFTGSDKRKFCTKTLKKLRYKTWL